VAPSAPTRPTLRFLSKQRTGSAVHTSSRDPPSSQDDERVVLIGLEQLVVRSGISPPRARRPETSARGREQPSAKRGRELSEHSPKRFSGASSGFACLGYWLLVVPAGARERGVRVRLVAGLVEERLGGL
jgi:hypothetical protein